MRVFFAVLFIIKLLADADSQPEAHLVPPGGFEGDEAHAEVITGESIPVEIAPDTLAEMQGDMEGEVGEEDEFELGEYEFGDMHHEYDLGELDIDDEIMQALYKDIEAEDEIDEEKFEEIYRRHFGDFDIDDDFEVDVGTEYHDVGEYYGNEETDFEGGEFEEYEHEFDINNLGDLDNDIEYYMDMLDESFDWDQLNLETVDYCEHFTAPEDGAIKMDAERCVEVQSAFCDCEDRPDFYYTPEQCLMLKYQFSFDYLMQDCCLDGTVENTLCSDYMEALALCECHPDEGECTEDEMMEDCDYLWDETMHMCRNVTAVPDWPVCPGDTYNIPEIRDELRL